MLLVVTILAAAAALWLSAKAVASLWRAEARLRRSPADAAAAMEELAPVLQGFSLLYSLPIGMLVALLCVRATIRRHGSPSLRAVADRVDFLMPFMPAVCIVILLLGVWYVVVRVERAQNVATSGAWRWSDLSLAFRLWMVLIALPIAVPILGLYLFWSRSPWSSLPILLVLLCTLVLLSNVLHPYVWLWGAPLRPLQEPALEAGARRLAEASRFPIESVFVVDPASEGLGPGDGGAFTSGLFGGARKVFLSDGLLRRCPPEQVLAVLAHEFAHVERRHTWKRAVLVILLAGTAMGISRWAGIFGEGPGETDSLAWKWAGIVFLLGGFLLLRAYQRATELEADRIAAERVGAEALIRALEVLEAEEDEDDPPPRSTVQRIFARLLATHPPLDVRRQRLGLAPTGTTGRGGRRPASRS